MSPSDSIKSNIQLIQQRINDSCKKTGRNPNEVQLLLATKTVSPEKIKVALETGNSLIGENKIQEVRDKYEALKDSVHQLHFIGHLQSNKIKDVLKYDVACIQSVDRLRLANRLQKRLEFEDKTIEVLLQFNTSYEDSKFGMSPEKAIEFTQQVAKLDRLKIKGLMTIGLFSAKSEKVRECFHLLKQVQQEIIDAKIPHVEMKELSMGMSGDLEIAIEEGATIIRVGTAIFGERAYPDSYYWDESGQ